MGRDKVITADEAMEIVMAGDTIATGGFVGIGFPEPLAAALERRFLYTGEPDLTLIFAAGQGDGGDRGLNHFGHPGMLRTRIGGHWGLVPALGRLPQRRHRGLLPATRHDQPLVPRHRRGPPGCHQPGRGGHVCRSAARGWPPQHADREHSSRSSPSATRTTSSCPRCRSTWRCCGARRPTTEGNVTMEHEAVTLEALSMAQAAKNSGASSSSRSSGPPTPRVVATGSQDPGHSRGRRCRQPPREHQQTFAETYNPAYTGEVRVSGHRPADAPDAAKGDRPARGDVPAPQRRGEPGHRHPRGDRFGGRRGKRPRPHHLNRGSRWHRWHPRRRPELRRHHQRRGDHRPALPVRLLRRRRARPGIPRDGAGGCPRQRQRQSVRVPDRRAWRLINISQSAKEVYFLGLFRAGATLDVTDGRLQVLDEGKSAKFRIGSTRSPSAGGRPDTADRPCTTSPNGASSDWLRQGLRVGRDRPGAGLRGGRHRTDGVPAFGRRRVDDHGPARFGDNVMGLAEPAAPPLGDRFPYDPDQNVLFCNFEGLTLDSPDDVAPLADTLNQHFEAIGKKVHVVINYDNFEVSQPQQRRSST